MKPLSSSITRSLADSFPEAAEELQHALRVGQVRAMWSKLVEPDILKHTNGVYIVKEDGRMVMHVYVDESIYAAELNNRRELLVLLCNEKFGEAIEQFDIHISYGLMKQRHPFDDDMPAPSDQKPPVPLDADEFEEVKKICETIENPTLREEFEKAMIADLEWKKGN